MSFLRKRGGFLNGVDGRIVDYRWTDESPSKDGPVPFKPGKVKGQDGKPKEKFHSLYLELHVRADGAKEDVTQSLFAGGWDDYEVTEDGKVLSTPDGKPVTIGESTAAGMLLASLFEAGLTLDDIGYEEDAPSIDLRGILNRRVRFVQRRNEEATKRLGKRVDPKNKNRSFDRTDLVVEQVYAADENPTPAVRTAATSTTRETKATASPSKANGKIVNKANAKAATPAVDIEELTESTLTEIIAEAGGSISKTKAGTKILQRLMKQTDVRDDVRKQAFNDAWLSEHFNYDQASGTISLNE